MFLLNNNLINQLNQSKYFINDWYYNLFKSNYSTNINLLIDSDVSQIIGVDIIFDIIIIIGQPKQVKTKYCFKNYILISINNGYLNFSLNGNIVNDKQLFEWLNEYAINYLWANVSNYLMFDDFEMINVDVKLVKSLANQFKKFKYDSEMFDSEILPYLLHELNYDFENIIYFPFSNHGEYLKPFYKNNYKILISEPDDKKRIISEFRTNLQIYPQIINQIFKCIIITRVLNINEINYFVNFLSDDGLLILLTDLNLTVNAPYEIVEEINFEMKNIKLIVIKKYSQIDLINKNTFNLISNIKVDWIINNFKISKNIKLKLLNEILQFLNYYDDENKLKIVTTSIEYREINDLKQKMEINLNDKYLDLSGDNSELDLDIIKSKSVNDIVINISDTNANNYINDLLNYFNLNSDIVVANNDYSILDYTNLTNKYDKIAFKIDDISQINNLIQGLNILKQSGLMFLGINRILQQNNDFIKLINNVGIIKNCIELPDKLGLIISKNMSVFEPKPIKQINEIKLNQIFEYITQNGHAINELLNYQSVNLFPLVGASINNDGIKGYLPTFDYDGEVYEYYTLNKSNGQIIRRNYKFSIINKRVYVLHALMKIDGSILKYINTCLNTCAPITLQKFNEISFQFN